MQKTKNLAFLCVLLFLLSFLAISFHHHSDGCSHSDCPICLASVVIAGASTGLSFIVFAVYLAASRLKTSEGLPRTALSLYQPSPRAPPA
jgi:aerobic-type carbon monoxide dehydrogenase small subunit (CoxS/CutS family)